MDDCQTGRRATVGRVELARIEAAQADNMPIRPAQMAAHLGAAMWTEQGPAIGNRDERCQTTTRANDPKLAAAPAAMLLASLHPSRLQLTLIALP